MTELKTSAEWDKLCNIKVLDPDGWDRSNFQYSWDEEKIDRDEFEKRVMFSTIQLGEPTIIWEDR